MGESQPNSNEELSLAAKIEAMLFVSAEPVPVQQLSQALDVTASVVERGLKELEDSLQTRGLRLQRNAARVQLTTAPQLAGLVEKTDVNQYADLLLKAAGLAKTIENPQKAVELYSRLADGMPQHPKAPTALFMLGFVYENDLGDLAKAKAIYESFLQKYPNDPDFADDAQTALKMLGKSPEEIIKEFEQQNRDSVQVK